MTPPTVPNSSALSLGSACSVAVAPTVPWSRAHDRWAPADLTVGHTVGGTRAGKFGGIHPHRGSDGVTALAVRMIVVGTANGMSR